MATKNESAKVHREIVKDVIAFTGLLMTTVYLIVWLLIDGRTSELRVVTVVLAAAGILAIGFWLWYVVIAPAITWYFTWLAGEGKSYSFNHYARKSLVAWRSRSANRNTSRLELAARIFTLFVSVTTFNFYVWPLVMSDEGAETMTFAVMAFVWAGAFVLLFLSVFILAEWLKRVVLWMTSE